jgi:uncharacterized protein (TIGR03067 family)
MHRADRPLEGCWEVIRAEFAGERAPELIARRITLEFSGDRYAVHFDGRAVDEGSFAAAEAGECLTLTLIGKSGTNAGRTIPAIYQCTGDRLRICYGFDGITPTRFTTTTGSQLYLATYRRRLR